MKTTDATTVILDRLAHVHELCPEMRFGQLLAAVGELAADATGRSLWDVDDEELSAAVEKFATDLARRDS